MCNSAIIPTEEFRASKIAYAFNPGAVVKGEFRPCHVTATIDDEEEPLIHGRDFESVRRAAIARILREAGE